MRCAPTAVRSGICLCYLFPHWGHGDQYGAQQIHRKKLGRATREHVDRSRAQEGEQNERPTTVGAAKETGGARGPTTETATTIGAAARGAATTGATTGTETKTAATGGATTGTATRTETETATRGAATTGAATGTETQKAKAVVTPRLSKVIWDEATSSGILEHPGRRDAPAT